MNISIFAKKAFRNRSDHHLMRVSSIIRGDQVATQIGARLNPEKGYENDVCIYVKPHVKPGHDFKFEKNSCLDIVDGWALVPLLQKHPEVGVIACSQQDCETLAKVLSNKIYFIPQHHCNFERIKKPVEGVTTVGCIGTSDAFPYLPQGLRERLAEKGIKLIEFSKFFGRQEILDFYQKIDVQIVWRPYMRKLKIRLSNPLKLVNASSFGIPTIALNEPAFKELEGCYIPISNLDEFMIQLERLKSAPEIYNEYSEKCLKKAEEYHIENVAKLYQKLI